MSSELDDILDDLFHGCAFAAFVEQAIAQGGPPDMEATRMRAYRHYEEALAVKNGRTRLDAALPGGKETGQKVSHHIEVWEPNALAKSAAQLVCGDCNEEMEAEEQPEPVED